MSFSLPLSISDFLMNVIVLLPFTSLIPCARRPSSFAKDFSHASFNSGRFIKSLYSSAAPVFLQVIAPAKNLQRPTLSSANGGWRLHIRLLAGLLRGRVLAALLFHLLSNWPRWFCCARARSASMFLQANASQNPTVHWHSLGDPHPASLTPQVVLLRLVWHWYWRWYWRWY